MKYFQSFQVFSLFSRFIPKQKESQNFDAKNEKIPDYSWTINTNFAAMAVAQPDVHSNNHDNNGAFNFEKFHKLKNNGLIRNESDHNSMENQTPASVWAMDCEDGLIVLGCADGRIEIWETMFCQFKVRKF